jgi:inhibitor of growth protein 3
MATAEDAASVLDQFVHDVANLPAEIAHLLEEIRAKDELIAECRQVINSRDNQIQKHVKQVGGHVKHPKEDQFMKTAIASYDKAIALQDDKVTLSQKSCSLVRCRLPYVCRSTDMPPSLTAK